MDWWGDFGDSLRPGGLALLELSAADLKSSWEAWKAREIIEAGRLRPGKLGKAGRVKKGR